ncbi:MAG: hypothetical protein P1Q69_01570 [Candidatus Thorarchaeota archaeon]|nr:hypothetical protein [Candidatus Thorarchaeota archaeon]
MNKATKFAVIGVALIVTGLLLNELAVWMYWQTALSNQGNPPHSIAPIAGTAFLLLIPPGLISLASSTYLVLREYRVEIRKVGSE